MIKVFEIYILTMQVKVLLASIKSLFFIFYNKRCHTREYHLSEREKERESVRACVRATILQLNEYPNLLTSRSWSDLRLKFKQTFTRL